MCDLDTAGGAVALANCVIKNWDEKYTIYTNLHYVLGAAGVLMPVLSTILSDVESRNLRRFITGVAAASVSLYAFLNPPEQAAQYKSAIIQLRHYSMEYQHKEISKRATEKDYSDFLLKIKDTEDTILIGSKASTNSNSQPSQPKPQ